MITNVESENFKLIIEYDGTDFFGWQRQKKLRTVQGEIEDALRMMTQQPISLIGSGRTDAGVHARGQVANFHCQTRLTPEAIQKGLNSLLRGDIVILSCESTAHQFHARYDVKCKTYHYRILNRPMPSAIDRRYHWFIHRKLDTDAMQSAIECLIGTHDFKAFEGVGSPRIHTVRTVFHAGLVHEDEDRICFRIQADGFLKFMVRNIVGTLAFVGLGKIRPEAVEQILETKDRTRAGPTAPPQGLFLMQVEY